MALGSVAASHVTFRSQMVQGSDIGSYGKLSYVVASKATLTVATPLAHHKIAHVVFSHDGIFVQFPYFLDQNGIVSRVEFRPGVGPPHKLKLDEYGKVTSHLIKLSHHTSGRAHFSQDGKVRTEVHRQSFRLDSSIGPVFQLFAFRLGGFGLFDPVRRKQDRAYIQFASSDSSLVGVNIQGEWRRKRDMEANVQAAEPLGPNASVVHRRTGVKSQVFFLSPPSPHPLDTHVLMLACSKADLPAGAEKPLVILLGGWDPGEIRDGDPPIIQTGCLVCLYPVASPDALTQRIGSIDLRPPDSPFS